MLTLVSYDIADDRRRTRLAKCLEDFGRRVQYSVFECQLEASQVDRLERRVQGLIEAEEDSVRIYLFCRPCEERLRILGLGVPTEDPEVYVL